MLYSAIRGANSAPADENRFSRPVPVRPEGGFLGKLTFATALLGLAWSLPAAANTVLAASAGSLPATAQDLTAEIAPTEIDGTLDFPDGVAMFKLYIPNPLGFAAFTVNTGAFGVPDPELFLFDQNGLGVYENDDNGGDTQACLPSSDSHNPCASSSGGLGPLTAGFYYLAITRAENSPLSASGYIFSPLLSSDVVGPDPTQGGGDPIESWDGMVDAAPDFDLINYQIEIADTPEPATWPLTAGVFGALVLYRRKARTR
jgi:hypothetical protein